MSAFPVSTVSRTWFGRLKISGFLLLVAAVLFGAACGSPEAPTTTVEPTIESIMTPVTTDTPVAVLTPTLEAGTPTKGLAPKATSIATPTRATANREPAVVAEGAVVRLVVEGTEWAPGNEIEVLIEVAPGTFGISAAELTLSFDPAVFQASAMEPGKLLGDNPLVALYEIDNDKGQLDLGLARLGITEAPTPKAVVAVASFNISATAAAGTHELTLTQIALADQDFEAVEDLTLSGLSIAVAQR